MQKPSNKFLLAALFAVVVVVPAWAQPQYAVFDLGPGIGYGINDVGQVAGKSYNPDIYGPAVWSFGIPVPTLLPASWSGTARDINNAGVLVGDDYDCPFGYRSPCGVQWFPPYSPANKLFLRGIAENSGIYAPAGVQVINNGGFAAGHSPSTYDQLTGSFTELHATFWDPTGTPTDIGVLSGDESLGYGINDANKVVGYSDGRVFYWGNVIVAKDVFPQMYGNTAYDINNATQFVGSYRTSGGYVAYRYDNSDQLLTTIGHLGAEGATGYAINDASEVVGVSALGTSGVAAFVWNEWDGILRLDQLIAPVDPLFGRVNLQTAWDINELGWIVVQGSYISNPGQYHVFVLMPLDHSAAYLTTGSPTSISQVVNTPDTPFELKYDYRFDTPTGVLTVRLDGSEIDTIPAAPAATMQTRTISIDAPHLNKNDIVLQFELDGPAGSSAALDNVMFPGLVNGRFGSGDLTAWTADGSAGVVELDPVWVTPEAVTPIRGQLVSGELASLSESDNVDYQMWPAISDTQSLSEFEVRSTSPTATPTTLEFRLEGAVFARSNVIQTVEFFDYDAQSWVGVGFRDAARSPAPDSVMVAVGTGDLSRFVEDGTLSIEARVRFQSENVPRQRFASNTDQAVWRFQ